MANGFYKPGQVAGWSAGVNLLADTIKVILIDNGAYTVNLDTHDNLNDVPAGARIATQTLGTKTLSVISSKAVFDAADVNFPTVSGATCEALIVYKDTGVESTSTLIYYADVVTGLPVTPTGGDIPLTWSASGILRFS